MSKPKKPTTTPKPTKTAPGRKPPVAAPTPSVGKPTETEDLVVFAFRLTTEERELIHKAAGPAKASRYVRTLAVAAANGDEELVLKLLGGPAPAGDAANG
jgi:hypothetical protein